MTKEQEEAISTMKHWIDYEKENKDKINKADELIEIQETVLSMLQEQQEENKKKDKIIDEQLKENVKLQTELNTENNRCMILANNDKFKEQVIDLMAKCIDVELSSARLEILLNKDVKPLETYKEDIKQHFAGLVEKE